MKNWTKVTPDEMKVGMSIANLKKGELQIKYAKDVCRLITIIDELEYFVLSQYSFDENGMKVIDQSKLQDKIHELKHKK